MHRILLAIPALNAAATLPTLIDSLEKSYPHLSILVVDDGSRDNTGDIALVHGAHMVSHERNLGKGAALRTAFSYALEHEFDAVITMDADLQHDPAEVQLFLDEFVSDYVMLIGTRPLSKAMPFPRKVSNSLSSFVASVFAGHRIVDSQCGFRLIPIKILRSLRLETNHYDLEPELVIRAARAGFRIKEIPVSTIYNTSPSAIRPLNDTLRFLKMLFKSLFW